MKTMSRLLLLLAVALPLLGCDERTEEVDSGGVLLEVGFGSQIPGFASMAEIDAFGAFVTDQLVITSFAPNLAGGTSGLMDVQLQGIEVLYERVDGGTRLPPPYYVEVIGTVPINGTFTITGMPLMSFDQVTVPPLTDLLVENGGFDAETGRTTIAMTLTIRAYGRTIGERSVASAPRRQTVEFFQ